MEKIYSIIDFLLEANFEKPCYYLTIISIVINILIIIWLYFKFQKKHFIKNVAKQITNFPTEDCPEVVELMITGKITHKSFIASIMNLISKGKLVFEKEYISLEDRYDYTLKLSGKESINLTPNEENLLHILFGSTSSLSITEIKRKMKNKEESEKIINKYYRWLNFTKEKYPQRDLFESMNIHLTFIYTFISLEAVLFIIYIGYSTFAILLPIMITALIIYISSISRYKYEISERIIKWKRFKKYINNFDKLKEENLPSKDLWIKYLAYSYVLDNYKDTFYSFMKTKSVGTNLSDENVDEVYDTLNDLNDVIKDIDFNLRFLTAKYPQKNITKM